jgi:hypothetical protein
MEKWSKMNWFTKFSAVIAVLGGLATLGLWPTGLASQAYDHFRLPVANSQWIALADFQRLNAIRKERQLTFQEWHTWCILGQQLGYWKRCPAR